MTFAVRLASAAPQTITATILVAGGALGTFPATITFPEGTTIQNFTYTAVEPGDDHLVVLGPDATVLGTAQVRATR